MDQIEDNNELIGKIIAHLKDSIKVKTKVIKENSLQICKAGQAIINSYKKGKKVIAFGNGGSAADAQHFVGELVGHFEMEREGLPAMALSTDTSVMTAISNDYGYENVFRRQIHANAMQGDIVVAISTSGNSGNVNNAIRHARDMGCIVIGLIGRDGGEMKDMCDIAIIVPSNSTPRIQEAHITILHILCDMVDNELRNTKKINYRQDLKN